MQMSVKFDMAPAAQGLPGFSALPGVWLWKEAGAMEGWHKVGVSHLPRKPRVLGPGVFSSSSCPLG